MSVIKVQPTVDEDEPLWTKLPDTQDHWLSLHGRYGWLRAVAKWDGCVDLDKCGNVSFSKDKSEPRPEYASDDYMHICDLDQFIEDLTALREEARKHFGEKWPDQ